MGYNSKELKASSPAKGPAKPKDVIYDPMGQLKYPGQITKIPGGDITMRNVSYPVLGVDDLGNQQMMYPEMDYTFPGQSVTEYPMHQMPNGSMMRNDKMPQAKTGGWLDCYQEGGTVDENKQFLINMSNSPLFTERYNKMLGVQKPQVVEASRLGIADNLNSVKSEIDPARLDKLDATGAYKSNTHTIYEKPEQNPLTKLHELSHASTRGQLSFKNLYKYDPTHFEDIYGADMKKAMGDDDYLLAKKAFASVYDNKPSRKYLTDASEIKARVDVSRKLLKDKNLYDPINNRFEEKDYDNLIKNFSTEGNVADLLHNFSKEDVIRMFNEIVTNNPKQVPVAKHGGWLDTMQNGGQHPEWYNGKQTTVKPDVSKMDQRKIPQSGMVVDKRTNQAYYFGDKGETGSFPVLTGKNPEGKNNTYSLSQLKKNAKLRNTPSGYYEVKKESTYKSNDMMDHYAGMMRDVEPISAYGVPAPNAKDLGFHLTYMDPFNPAVYKNRDSLYRGKETDRNASYGCINCEKESYEAFNKALPKTDTMMVLDSQNPMDLKLLEQAKARMKKKPLMQNGGVPFFKKESDKIVAQEKMLSAFKPQDFKALKAGYAEHTRGANQADGSGISSMEMAWKANKLADPTFVSNLGEVIMDGYMGNEQNPLNIAGAIPIPYLSGVSKLAKNVRKYYMIDKVGDIVNKSQDVVEAFKQGGSIKGLKKFTSKNIKTSVNKLLLRNETLFGPQGRKIYDPNANNWLEKYK